MKQNIHKSSFRILVKVDRIKLN